MDSRAITPEQAVAINTSLYRSLNYLGRLRARMVKVGFPPDDDLLQLVDQAYNAVHSLSVRTHYLSCKTGVAMERKPAE